MTTTRSNARSGCSRAPVAALAVISALSLAACARPGPPTGAAGATAVAGTTGGQATGLSGLALATSLAGSDGTSWAVVDMGNAASTANSFWELFVRPAGSSAWRVATPAGVASNGGLVMTQSGAGTLLTGFRPSQKLTFSPLASSTDAGAQWSAEAPLDFGLADVPGALAGNSAGAVLALTQTGDVESATAVGAEWNRLTSLRALAAGAAGRSCGLTALTAVAWTPAGAPLVAGDCSKPGVTGIFALSGGVWHAAAPRLTGALARGATDVVGLATTAGRTTAALTARAGGSAFVVAAWSSDGGAHWARSAPLPTPGLAAGSQLSASFSADGSAGLVVTPAARRKSPSQMATIGWRASAWYSQPALPTPRAAGARTSTQVATLATAAGSFGGSSPEGAAASGSLQALEVDGATMTVWQLGAGGWTPAQRVRVAIPYGSSG